MSMETRLPLLVIIFTVVTQSISFTKIRFYRQKLVTDKALQFEIKFDMSDHEQENLTTQCLLYI